MLELRYFGRPRVTLDGEVVSDFVSDKALALLLYLALNEGRQSRKALAGLLWGEMPGKRARANLRVALHNLKKQVPGYLQITRKRVTFAQDKAHWSDLSALAEAAERGDGPEALADAISLYEDDFLKGLSVNGAPDLEVWLQAERERWRLRLVEVLERLGERHSERRRWSEAIAVLRRLLAVEPWRERTHRRLMLLLARQGQYAAALAQYEQCRDLLATQLGVEPMPETEKLHARIRQLRARSQHKLPQPWTPLVGREGELRRLRKRLDDRSCRLLTLYGPGGIGKSRLALALGESVQDRFLEGVYYVPLSDVEAPRRMPLAIAEAMGLSFAGPRPFAEQLLRQLDGREVLLILDNFEQLLTGTPFVQRLLESVPGVKVLAVSRAVLNLPREWTFEVTGLEAPDPGSHDVATTSAVQLFLQRAQQDQHDFAPGPSDLQAIAQICCLLDGVPLALEQAASWLRVLTCQQLLSRLEQGVFSLAHAAPHVSERHRSMEAVLEQSWRLLGVEERTAFQGLSVFRGGFTQEAAAEVVGASLQTLAALVDHSMIRFDEDTGRYQAHALLRQFGAEKLADDEEAEAEARDRHAAYFAGFMQRRRETLEGSEEKAARNRILQEQENVTAAWEYLLLHPDIERMQAFVRCFWYLFELEGWYREGVENYRDSLAKLNASAFTDGDGSGQRLRGQLLSHHGWFLVRTGDFVEAQESLEKGVGLLRRHGTEADLAIPLFFWGFSSHLMGEYRLGRELLEESLAIHDETGARFSVVFPRAALAFLLLATGEIARAQRLADQIERESKALGGHRVVSNALYLQGMCALARQDISTAERYLQEGLAVSKAAEDVWNTGMCSHYMGRTAILKGEYETAREWLHDGLSSMRSLEERLGIVFCLLGLGWAEQGLGNLRESRACFDEALAIAKDIHVRPQVLEALAGIASCLLAGERAVRARDLLSIVAAHPSTAHPVRQQAQMLLSKLPKAASAKAQHGSVGALEPLVAELIPVSALYNEGT